MSHEKTTPTLSTEQREARAAMNAELRKEYDEIYKEAKGVFKHEIWARYAIGERVRDITENERKYGESAVDTIAIALGGMLSTVQLYDFRQFANIYSREDVERLLEKPIHGGGRFTWTHFRELARIKGADADKDRERMEHRIVKEGISSDQVARDILRLAAHGAKRSQGGRKPIAPKSIKAGLSQLSKYREEVENRLEGWKTAVFEAIDTAGPDEIDEELTKMLSETVESQRELGTHVDWLIDKLSSSLERCHDIIAKKAQAESSESDDEPEKKKAHRSSKSKSRDKKHRHAIERAKKKKRRLQPT